MSDLESIMSCLTHPQSLSLQELIFIREFIHEQIDKKKELMREDFKKKVMDEATELGVSLKFDSPVQPRKILKAKYRDPANADNTWSGRGKKPTWLKNLLASGITLESLLIQPNQGVDTEVGF